MIHFSHASLLLSALLGLGLAAVGMALNTGLNISHDLIKLMNTLGFADKNGNLKGPVGGALGTFAMYDQARDLQQSVAGVGNGADTTDDTLFSTVVQNELANNGDEYVIEASGVTGATVNNKRIKVFFGATLVADSGVITSNALPWAVYVRVKRTAAGTQYATGEFTVHNTATQVTKSTPAETLANAITIKVTGASTTTGAANDVVGLDYSVTRRGLAS